jgi:uncharacterized protein
VRRFDLRSLRFGDASETWRRLPEEMEPFVFGGLDYVVAGGEVDLLLTAARVGDSVTLTAEFDTAVVGPCQRCLEDADVALEVRGADYVRHGDSEGDEEGDEGYVTASIVDLERWVRDLIAEALPPKVLCRDDCRGLCGVCGADLNKDPEHGHDEA